MKKIIIIGSKGMAGHLMYNFFKETTEFNVVDISRDAQFHTPSYQIDLSDFKSVNKAIDREMPEIVINCVGILNNNAESHPDTAILMNSYFPHFLAHTGNEMGFKLIHISTDCVFSGKKGGYTEQSERDGVGFYAQTKALGEVTYGKHLTFRTSIIGPELKTNGIGLFNWFMQQQGTIKGYTEAYWTGVTTLELAKAIIAAINQDLSGLHHLVNGEKISKYDLLQLFKIIFKKPTVEIIPFVEYKVDKSLINTNNDFDYTVPPYKKMIEDLENWVKGHPNLYNYTNTYGVT